MALLTGIILLAIGLIACFYGKRLYRVVLALFGFIAGYYAAWAALVQQSDVVQVVGAIIVGLVVAFVFWSLYKAAHVLFGAFLGLALGTVIANAFNLDGVVYLVVVVVLAIIGALIGISLADMMIRLATAFGGASQAVSGLAAIAAALGISLPLVDPSHSSTVVHDTTAAIVTFVLVIVLGILGYVYQTQRD
ncbi:MAG: DUF4203 domain-containing protein [Anaerolineae bacterium]|nr:DUF4203 domain-containing protein [Anaerolineae bacterium]